MVMSNSTLSLGNWMKLGYGDSRQGRQESEEFDTVLLAIGRTGEAHKLGLADAGASRLQHPDV